MPVVTGVLEAAVYVDDLDKAEAFYGGVLGLETAGALGKAGVDVTVLEGADTLMQRQLAAPAGHP